MQEKMSFVVLFIHRICGEKQKVINTYGFFVQVGIVSGKVSMFGKLFRF